MGSISLQVDRAVAWLASGDAEQQNQARLLVASSGEAGY